MDNTNEQAQVEQETVEQEETTQEEQTPKEDIVTLPKDKFTRMQRKAMAYDAIKKNPVQLPTKKEADDEIVKSVKRLEEIENKRQFGFENNLSPEETDFIFKVSQGKPTKEDLENPFIKAGLEGYRSKKRLESNTPSSSSTSKVFRDKQFSEMSKEEQQKAFEAASPLLRK